jgi:hypothetical protein
VLHITIIVQKRRNAMRDDAVLQVWIIQIWHRSYYLDWQKILSTTIRCVQAIDAIVTVNVRVATRNVQMVIAFVSMVHNRTVSHVDEQMKLPSVDDVIIQLNRAINLVQIVTSLWLHQVYRQW